LGTEKEKDPLRQRRFMGNWEKEEFVVEKKCNRGGRRHGGTVIKRGEGYKLKNKGDEVAFREDSQA